MKLNNGRYVVDTDESEFIAKSRKARCNDGYSHEEERIFSLWKSNKTGKLFITMEYWEYISFLFLKSTPTHGHSLVDVYETLDKARKKCDYYDIPIPEWMLEQA